MPEYSGVEPIDKRSNADIELPFVDGEMDSDRFYAKLGSLLMSCSCSKQREDIVGSSAAKRKMAL
jgi:hypothetical protein